MARIIASARTLHTVPGVEMLRSLLVGGCALALILARTNLSL